MKIGTCKLTLHKGKFVKAHIIPKAFTYPEEPGLPFTQGGSGRKPVRRWSSWYDPRLVIEEGERILRDLDTWAIQYLRSRRLVWSGWGAMLEVPVQKIGLDYGWGIRKVDVPDPRKLRLFFLSLLWRAAATDMFEFGEVTMPPDHLERLRRVVLGESAESEAFYPATLTQLSTMGIIHNHGAIAQSKTIPAYDNEPSRIVPIFRFYFDGLIVHFHRQAEDNGYTKELGSHVVGQENELVLSTVTFERSFQFENLMWVMAETDYS